ncbi:MAG: precorrin-2 dehydrogenase [Lactococcus sp.]|jgi:precorrin-2 dehydrogenase / sirohydrochlorin ferrochelatase
MLPILLDLRDKQILVVGGGKVATRKILRLSQENGTITVIAPDISQTIAELIPAKQIHRRPYQIGDVTGFDMIFICTSDHSANHQIISEIQPHQLFNDTTDHQNSDFYSMAELTSDDVTIALSSKGVNPSKIKQLKEKLVAYLHEKN